MPMGNAVAVTESASLAVANPGTIDLLITIDPVSEGSLFGSGFFFSDIRNSVGTWIDASQQDSIISLLSGIGLVTQWGSGVNGYATQFVPTDYSHGDFPYTMNYLYTHGYLPSGLNWEIKPPY